jgi:hypothetical protein
MPRFEVVDAYPGAHARLRSPNGRTTIALHVVDPGQRMNAKTEGLRLYFEVKGLDAFCKALADMGVKLDQLPKKMPWAWKHAYLRDPDGHEISLYWAGKTRLQKTVMGEGPRELDLPCVAATKPISELSALPVKMAINPTVSAVTLVATTAPGGWACTTRSSSSR